MSRSFIQLFLTCANTVEAGNISSTLLDQRLIACAKALPVASSFNWDGKLNNDEEVLLIMDSAADLFDEINMAITKLHSYDVYNLQAATTTHISKPTTDWLNQTLRPANLV